MARRKSSHIPKGKTVTRKMTRGPNKGDTHRLRGTGDNFYPVGVVSDRGRRSTLRDNPGVKFGKGGKGGKGGRKRSRRKKM